MERGSKGKGLGVVQDQEQIGLNSSKRHQKHEFAARQIYQLVTWAPVVLQVAGVDPLHDHCPSQ